MEEAGDIFNKSLEKTKQRRNVQPVRLYQIVQSVINEADIWIPN